MLLGRSVKFQHVTHGDARPEPCRKQRNQYRNSLSFHRAIPFPNSGLGLKWDLAQIQIAYERRQILHRERTFDVAFSQRHLPIRKVPWDRCLFCLGPRDKVELPPPQLGSGVDPAAAVLGGTAAESEPFRHVVKIDGADHFSRNSSLQASDDFNYSPARERYPSCNAAQSKYLAPILCGVQLRHS